MMLSEKGGVEMKIVIAPDSFKEALSAAEVAKAIRDGFAEVFPKADYALLPVGDGGEGTLRALSSALGAELKRVWVSGPFLDLIEVELGFANEGKTAFIEMAEVVGLELVPEGKRDPLNVSTRGVGELILHAARQGATEIVIGIGGTASQDGGIGMAEALGYRFFDQSGQPVDPLGKNLHRISKIDKTHLDPLLNQITITVITDVTNPLCGESGAAAIFGRQKGLPQEAIREADQALYMFYNRFFSVPEEPGSGAGGGMGAGLAVFAGGKLVRGIDYVIEVLELKRVCADADIVITGEGSMDGQTASGKAPLGVLRAVPAGIPVIAICGSVLEGSEHLYEEGMTAIFPSINEVAARGKILQNTRQNLTRTARNIAKLLEL